MTKDEWIQKAKALFFDLGYACDSAGLKREMEELLKEGGGYDYMVESSKTPLKWKED